jgi:hypothetical protein
MHSRFYSLCDLSFDVLVVRISLAVQAGSRADKQLEKIIKLQRNFTTIHLVDLVDSITDNYCKMGIRTVEISNAFCSLGILTVQTSGIG